MPAFKPRIFLKGLVLIVTFVAVAFLFEVSHLSSLLDKDWIDSQVRGQGLSGELLFLAMGAFATAIAVPRQAVSFLGGYAFGFLLGTLLSVLATVGGCVLSFFYARWFGRELVKNRFPARIQRVDGFIRENTFSMTLLIRLLPVGSNILTSLAAGVSSVRAMPFLLGSALGYIPQTAVFALVGSGISLDPTFRIGLGVFLFVISGFLGIYLFRRFRRGHHLDPKLEAAMGVDDD